MICTTSWDDGHTLDLRLAELLSRHGATGTLYVSKTHPQVPVRLDERALRDLCSAMEIGAHTITHPDLAAVSSEEASREITESKAWIESVTQKPCAMFCYPKGRWNAAARDAVKAAGFSGARTTEGYRFAHEDPFIMPVSLQIYPFPFRPVLNRRCIDPLRRAWTATHGMAVHWYDMRGWLPFAKALFLHAQKSRQPWFHLWGHSWEVERYGMWAELESLIAFMKQNGATFVPNSGLLHAHPSPQ